MEGLEWKAAGARDACAPATACEFEIGAWPGRYRAQLDAIILIDSTLSFGA